MSVDGSVLKEQIYWTGFKVFGFYKKFYVTVLISIWLFFL